MEITIGTTAIRSIEADLTTLEVDAIVNAANERLAHGGGLAAAIVRAGGEVIQEESDAWVLEHGPLSPGVAAVTGAGNLACRGIVHVAGPVYKEGRDNQGLLRAAVGGALKAAAGEAYRTLAMPAISAGVFGYPRTEACAVIAAETARLGFDREAAADFAAGLEALSEN
jgi:putative ATPase